MLLRYFYIIPLLLLIVLNGQVYSGSTGAHLLVDGESDFVILLSDQNNHSIKSSALIFQDYFHQISGVKLPINHENTPSNHFIQFICDDKCESFGKDGFNIKINEGSFFFTAKTAHGLHNAVYTFLEKYLDCRKFSVTEQYIPSQKDIFIPDIDDTQVPLLTFRMQDFKTPGYNDWHKLNSLEDWGLFVHTFDDLVPPDKYFKNHPEYYSEHNGVRVRDGQLCLSNPEVLEIVINELRHLMKENPDAQYWSVSQNDTYMPCSCEKCRAIDQEEGGHSGSILRFVNKVAAEFPDKTISTLAYQYSRSAPRITKPLPNVNIMLCSIESDRSKPIAEGDPSFVKDIQDWSMLTNNIFLWDYVIQFRNLLSPFPNLMTLQPNMQFFVENGITAVFEQGLRNMHGEFAELRAYMISKLLWDPYVDIDSVMTDFLDRYYGNGAPHIRRYIDFMHAALKKSGEGLSCFGYPFPSENGYLSATMIASYRVFFDQAETAVINDPVFLRRVQTARLPLQYARLEQAKILADQPGGCFYFGNDGKRKINPKIDALLDTFHVRCIRGEIDKLWEHGITPDEYFQTAREFLSNSTTPHLALNGRVELEIPASPKYHNGDKNALTNGLTAWNDYNMHWLGFEGEDIVATVDLGETKEITSIRTAFLQDIIAWIFMPVEVEFSVSLDGKNYQTVDSIPAPIRQKQEGAIRVPMEVTFEKQKARYIRIHAQNMKTCPTWHKGSGGPAWIFCDEIRVN